MAGERSESRRVRDHALLTHPAARPVDRPRRPTTPAELNQTVGTPDSHVTLAMAQAVARSLRATLDEGAERGGSPGEDRLGLAATVHRAAGTRRHRLLLQPRGDDARPPARRYACRSGAIHRR